VVSLGAYVDLNYLEDASISTFSGAGDPRSLVAMTYDTWSTHYERDGFNQIPAPGMPPPPPNVAPFSTVGNSLVDEATDGLDNDDLGGADDEGELEAPAPYRVPLRGIQVKIRVFEPDSRQVRELTVVHKFLPE
jgi:hypothetical protein